MKYNSSGTKQWTRQLGSSGSDRGKGIAIDNSSNIYLVGTTSGGLDGNTLGTGSSTDIFLVKYDSDGNKQ